MSEFEKKLEWCPIGVIGEILLDEDSFQKCCKLNNNQQVVDFSAIDKYEHSKEIDKMFIWFIESGYGCLVFHL